ncbi:phage major capsid protein [Mycobacteroides abscessus]|uniref:phage major capsid protein n=1 Tax=Mycobacteroides abscessus TaxID=36809 RepID=UPI0005E0DFB2|nr:phage major capsid protein [Mycobacteroides abscessus]CPR79279.1 HK97 family phage prohead protease [Mycobacteroides abscessus]CPR88431.1 HK97 family phage prohead protease [Mycobacteroides abscessus]CPS43356.1 HK97 family phage prohead protease [Mycobacteroides abscessus]CPV03159.1 HK97 family phage prohead protease [Mycobacteroides abscessus]
MSARLLQLKERADAAIKTARDIAAAAEADNRDFKDNEQVDYDTAVKAAEDILKAIKAVKADEAILTDAENFAKGIGVPETKGGHAELSLSLGATVIQSPEFKAMMDRFKTGHGEYRVPDRAKVQSDAISLKSLFTGQSRTSAGAFIVPDRTDIVEMLGRRPLRLRDLCAKRRTTSDIVEFVQEVSHTNNAAAVAEATSSAAPTAPGSAGPLVNDPNGGYKPEGAWAFQVKQANVKTIAEWVPASKRSLADVAQLEGLINDELQLDILEKEDSLFLTGDGVGENHTGILNTSGIQTQAFATDIFTSIRKAITKARTVGRVQPSAVLVSPAVKEQIELTKDSMGRFYYAGPFNTGVTTLWGLPVADSEIMPDTHALVGDFSKAVIWDREQTSVTMTDSHADFFTRNLVAILAEERNAFAVTRPTAFVKTAVA